VKKPLKLLIIMSMRSTSMHRVMSEAVVSQGWHQQINTNAILNQKRRKDQHLVDVPVVDPKSIAFLVNRWWLW
jgi:hypothetical protein